MLFSQRCYFFDLFCFASVGFSQRKEAQGSLKGKGTIFIELLGNGVWYSVNYDRVIYHGKRDAISWRAGAAYWPFSNDIMKSGSMVFLGELNYLRGKFGGAGAIPGAAIGGIVGSVYGYFTGHDAATDIYNSIE